MATLIPNGRWPAFRVEHVEATGSTNADVLAAARAGAPAGLVVMADHQRAGRGRLGRSWEDRVGDALLASILLRPAPGTAPHELVSAVAIAATDACADMGGFRPELKWPNDLLVGERKLAGILAETLIEDGKVAAVVVGIGLNVRSGPGGAVCVAELAVKPVSARSLLDSLLGYLAALEPELIGRRYREALGTIGRRVRVERASDVVEGVALEVEDDGRLVVQTGAGERIEITVGDVVHLRSVG